MAVYESNSLLLFQILVLTGVFATFMAVYESIEYIFCYNNEKKEQEKLMSLNRQAERLAGNRADQTVSPSSSERQTLLHSPSSQDGEMIPLQQLSSNHTTASNMQNCASTSTDLLRGTGLDERTILLANGNSSDHSASSNSKSSSHPNGRPKNSTRDHLNGDITNTTSQNSRGIGHMTRSGDLYSQSHDNSMEYDSFVSADDFLR